MRRSSDEFAYTMFDCLTLEAIEEGCQGTKCHGFMGMNYRCPLGTIFHELSHVGLLNVPDALSRDLSFPLPSSN